MGTSGSPGDQIQRTFRERLNGLFATAAMRGERVTNRALARWLAEHGYEGNEAYVSHLRSGRATSPSLRIIEGIAAYFDVPSANLLSEEEAQVELDELLRDHGVRSIAARAVGLSAENISAIAKVLDGFRVNENLPPVSEHDVAEPRQEPG